MVTNHRRAFLYPAAPLRPRRFFFMCDNTHFYVWHASRMNWVTNQWHRSLDSTAPLHLRWLLDMCDMTHLPVWHDPSICVTWLTNEWSHERQAHFSRLYSPFPPSPTPLYVWHDSFTCLTWLICLCDMTHLHVWHDSRMNGVTNNRRAPLDCTTPLRLRRFLHMCDMAHLHAWHDSFTCVTWLIYMCDVIHLHVWHASCPTRFNYMCDMTHLQMCAMTHKHMGSRTTGTLLLTLQALSALADSFIFVT